MLSYRHAFHAGNHADVLKHAILSRLVISFERKTKPFTYIDSHAGAGIYSLDSDWAKKTAEAEAGIYKVFGRTDCPDLLFPYLTTCRNLYKSSHQYPGSPELVRALSRADDQLILMELHPTEIENLRRRYQKEERIHIHHRDGFDGLIAVCPPEPRRGFTLLDPSYEDTEDYKRTAQTVIAVHKRWSAGTIAVWYPLLPYRNTECQRMKDAMKIIADEIIIGELKSSPDSSVAAPRLSLKSSTHTDSDGYGLSGSGMLLVNPPWKLQEELEVILPWIANVLNQEISEYKILHGSSQDT